MKSYGLRVMRSCGTPWRLFLCGSYKISFPYHDGTEAFSRGRPRGTRSLVPSNQPSSLG